MAGFTSSSRSLVLRRSFPLFSTTTRPENGNAGQVLMDLSDGTLKPPGRAVDRDRYTAVMVRRDEVDRASSSSRCSSPAGATPVSVSTGAPSGRSQASGENAMVQAGCQKPLRRKPARGPQPNVKPAASTQLQPETLAPEPRFATPRALFEGGFMGWEPNTPPTYDVSPDGDS
jgi:hypothetical protein